MPLKILHLEDSAADAELVRGLLEEEGISCNVTCVKTKPDYAAELKRGEFDLILSDYSLPRFDGLTALDMARKEHPEKPVIFVSGTMGEEAAVESLKRGATDYVLKHQLARLPAAVKRAISDAQELTLRKQAEEKIREQAALLDLAQDAILVRDLSDRVLYWNKSAERLYGWTAEEALGKNAAELLYEGESMALKRAREEVLERGQWVGELEQVTRNGRPITVQSRWTLVRDQAGNPKSKLILNSDVTERKKLEAQFLRAQRFETIGALAGGIAHDLGNMLTPILIGTEALANDVTGASPRKMLQTMHTSARHGLDMIKQILAFARGVGGEPAVLDLGPLLREMQELAHETFPRSIHTEVHANGQLHPVLGNPTQLRQVLLNLCVNARDAMPAGGSLKLSAENLQLDNKITSLQREPVSGQHVMIAVSDSGHGIEPHMLEKIFEPFFTTKEPGKGTGLGLSTVQGIVKSHGGFLDVSSEVGKGTIFTVFLPAYQKQS
jgi:two-component system, cell cycle sensor histidine kinase and response regulator CckA